MQIDWIEKNENFVVINKPSGVLSVPDRIQSQPSLKDFLLQQFPQVFTVHRLDKDTSGVIIYALNEATHKTLNTLFEERKTTKIYNGLVQGIVVPLTQTIEVAMAEHPGKNGTMITHASGKQAITAYKVLQQFTNCAFVEFNIYTGRTHQIRVHCKHIGHSIIADELYGDGKPLLLSSFKKKFNLGKHVEEEKPLLKRLALHAKSIGFTINDTEYFFEAALPKDIKATLQQLEKWSNKITLQ